MPKLRQPGVLRQMSFEVLLEYVVKCCDECSAKNSLKKLRQSVSSIKENVCMYLPRWLLTDFCNELLTKFYVKGRPVTHNIIALEIIMDLRISELRIASSGKSHFVNDLNNLDADRLRGLEKLYMEYPIEAMAFLKSEKFYLAYLIELSFLLDCDDADLEVIGKNCLKLRELGIYESSQVTDRGLRALNQLSELRCIVVSDCPEVSLDIIYDLLYVHKKIEKLLIYPDFTINAEHFNTFSRLKLGISVFPSVKCLIIPMECYSSSDFESITYMFPNLTSIDFYGHVSGDLRILKNLNNLSLLDFTYACGVNWTNLEQLFRSNGSNITELRTGSAYMTQNDLDMIFRFCKKIGILEFSYSPESSGKVLSIPPFKKLKILLFDGMSGSDQVPARVKFGKMSRLEYLRMRGFNCSTKMIKEMILDNKNFPNLRDLVISEGCDMNCLRKTVKYRNLDMSIMEH